MYNCYPAMSIDSCVLVPTIHTYNTHQILQKNNNKRFINPVNLLTSMKVIKNALKIMRVYPAEDTILCSFSERRALHAQLYHCERRYIILLYRAF